MDLNPPLGSSFSQTEAQRDREAKVRSGKGGAAGKGRRSSLAAIQVCDTVFPLFWVGFSSQFFRCVSG